MTTQEWKELRLHTLRGDIQQIGMETTSTKRGIGEYLARTYLTEDAPITREDFDRTLDEEYAKVEAWRKSQS